MVSTVREHFSNVCIEFLKLLPMGGASDVAPAVLVEGDHKHKPRPANTH